MNEAMLRASLSLAVPMWADRLRSVPFRDLLARAPEIGQHIASKGDCILFKSKKGETAEAFNQLAEGLAILSFVPSGVTFMGDHYKNEHPGQEDPSLTDFLNMMNGR